MTTISDVAREAGVSTATVSYVINGTKKVSNKTKEKVYAAIKKLNFRPSKIAQSLATNSTHVIGVLISDVANPFFSSIVRGIQNTVNQNGYIVMVGNSDEDSSKAKMYLEVLTQHRIDGLIISPTSGVEEYMDLIRNLNIPVVFVNRRCDLLTADSVETDNENGAYLAVKHLISMSHTKIALITGPSSVSTYTDRVKGYLDALKEAGIPVDGKYILEGGYSYESGYRLTYDLMRLADRPTAIFVASGWLSRGVFLALKELKIARPEELSLISFDETEWASLVNPPLTTVAQRTYEMGQVAAMMLLERLGHNVGELQLVDGDKIIRIPDTNFFNIKLGPRMLFRESTVPLRKV